MSTVYLWSLSFSRDVSGLFTKKCLFLFLPVLRLSVLLSSNYRVIKKYEAVRVPHRALGTADLGDPSNITLFRGTWNLTGAIRLTERQQMMRDKDQVIKNQ